jgi:outer membrane protein
MRLRLWLSGMCVLLATPTWAQLANKSLGLETGYLSVNGTAGDELDFGVPVGLAGSIYIDQGFELVAHLGIMAVHDRVLNQNVLALDGPALGVRYLLLEERIRPFVGLDVNFLYLPGNVQQPSTAFAGLGPNAGAELLLNDGFSIGLCARFNWYVSPIQMWESFGATLRASTYF